MQRPRSLLSFLVQSVIVGLACAFLLLHLAPGLAERIRGGGTTAPASPLALSYADAVQRATPAVVSIYADRVITERLLMLPDPSLQRFSGVTLGPTRTRLARALGSGVIVSEDGYVLTNHHVIQGAEQIRLVLWDGRVTEARVVGSDAETDLAVLKVEGSGLPALALDPQLQSRVGDVVLAIGNPFGLNQTVTQGIVSGLARSQVAQALAEDFIQTDAAINEGNSGGALIDARGQLIGINTFVLGRIHGAEGIGFAIPIRTAAHVLQEIRLHGKVIRGWIGAEYGDAPLLPGSLNFDGPRGVALTRVYPVGPAHAAGLRPGDVLLEFNGAPIIDHAGLRLREAALAPGASVSVAGLRAGVPFQIELELAERPSGG